MIAVKGGNGSGKNYRPATHFLQEKQMATRIYQVTNGDKVWLVRASTKNQAVAYAARREMNVRVATQDDLVQGLEKGLNIENAKDEGVE